MASRAIVGRVFGHYRVIAELGAGGMGEVYRAHDVNLQRDVALKVLPGSAAVDATARARLLHEARTASQLNHPNICTIYEVGQDGDETFIAMELVAGESLRARLQKGPLTSDLVVRFGAQLAAALAHAHQHRVLHRDLKSANVMITPDDQVKVLDFGLAKRIVDDGLDAATRSQLSLTQAGFAMGTLGYMAPEQLRGDDADVRSDVFALGVVLYEMACGEVPFRGRTAFELSSSVLHQSPAPLPATVPAGVRELIERCLEKEPDRRFQTATEVGAALQGATSARAARPSSRGVLAAAMLVLAVALTVALVMRRSGGGTSSSVQSIAVLPLASLSADPQQDYFADGMTEELTSDLAKISALRVISRTSAMQYKGSKKSVPEIARELNVDAVVEGSVLRAGNRVRITAQLINARLDRHMWSESYDGDVNSVLDLQQQVARAVAQQVQAKVTPEQQAQLNTHRAVPADVLDTYLHGLYLANQGTPEGLQASLASFQQVVAREPSFAPAYAQLANVYTALGTFFLPPREMMPKAEEYARKALELDETLSEAHAQLAAINLFYHWDWGATERESQRALQLDANNADAHDIHGIYLLSIGQFDRGIAELQRSRELDPYGLASGDLVFWPILARRYKVAVANGQQALALRPQAGTLHTFLGVAYAMDGQFIEAVKEGEEGHRLDPNPLATSFLASVYARAGRRADAQRTLASLNEQLKSQYSCAYEVAVAYVELRQFDEAFRRFDQAYESRSDCMVLLKFDPRLDAVRQDRRYQALLQKMQYPK